MKKPLFLYPELTDFSHKKHKHQNNKYTPHPQEFKRLLSKKVLIKYVKSGPIFC